MMITRAETDAVNAARDDGLRFHSVVMAVGGLQEFVAHSWQDAGFYVGDDGMPVRDWHGNTVRNAASFPISSCNRRHVQACVDWFDA